MSGYCYRASDWSSPQLLALVVAIEEYGDTLPQGSTERDCIREAVRQIGLADKHTEAVAGDAPLSLPVAKALGDGIIADANDLQNRDSAVRNTQQTSDMVERVARAMAQASGRDPEGVTAPARGQMGSRRLWELYLPQATSALEASHHAELVEALRKAAPFIGWAMSRGCGMLAGSQPEPLCDQIDALLANVGCHHSLIVSGERMVCTKCDYSTDFASSAAKIGGEA